MGVIAFTPDGKTAYAGGNGTVTPIKTATNTPGKPIRVGMEPTEIAITPDGKTAYAVGFQGAIATVLPISTATNTPGKPIHLPRGSDFTGFIAITPDGKTAYVTGGPPGDEVTPINTATNTLGKPIRVAFHDAAADEIAITPDGKTAYVASYGGALTRSSRSAPPPTRPASPSTSEPVPPSRSPRTGRLSTSLPAKNGHPGQYRHQHARQANLSSRANQRSRNPDHTRPCELQQLLTSLRALRCPHRPGHPPRHPNL